jgi:hypothetical protein
MKKAPAGLSPHRSRVSVNYRLGIERKWETTCSHLLYLHRRYDRTNTHFRFSKAPIGSSSFRHGRGGPYRPAAPRAPLRHFSDGTGRGRKVLPRCDSLLDATRKILRVATRAGIALSTAGGVLAKSIVLPTDALWMILWVGRYGGWLEERRNG